eukprot:SAG31_NODE_60_length_29419_cov_39.876398_23_plen_68_part_00
MILNNILNCLGTHRYLGTFFPSHGSVGWGSMNLWSSSSLSRREGEDARTYDDLGSEVACIEAVPGQF